MIEASEQYNVFLYLAVAASPPQFSWIDHRLVRDRHISRCSADTLALVLVTVADGQGLSHYADATICRLLPLRQAQGRLLDAEPTPADTMVQIGESMRPR